MNENYYVDKIEVKIYYGADSVLHVCLLFDNANHLFHARVHPCTQAVRLGGKKNFEYYRQ
jgi:hypothetical protein